MASAAPQGHRASTAEIVEQVRAASVQDEFGDRLSNIVSHGDGRTTGELLRAYWRRLPHNVRSARRVWHLRAIGDRGVDGRLPRHPQAGLTSDSGSPWRCARTPDDELRDTPVPVTDGSRSP